MIHIDRVNTDVEVLKSPATGNGMEPGTAPSSGAANGVSADRLRHLVMEILREHLRDLERQGLL